jgi:hypothetical protein
LIDEFFVEPEFRRHWQSIRVAWNSAYAFDFESSRRFVVIVDECYTAAEEAAGSDDVGGA